MTICYRGFKNIVIDGPAAQQRNVVEQLNRVWATWAGWAVLRSIIDSPRTLTIVPFSAAEMNEHRAYVRPTWWLRSMDATPAEEQMFLGGEDDPSTPQDERYRVVPLLRGTGRGTDAEMHYMPSMIQYLPGTGKIPEGGEVPLCRLDGTPNGPCRLGRGRAARSPDNVLVHELTHALRYMRGLINMVPTLDKAYDNEEEFFAILVANIYMSETGRTMFLASHHNYDALPAELSTSEGFLGKGVSPPSHRHLENRRLVHKFVCQCYGLCALLFGKVSAAFNPIREFMRNSQLYPLCPR
jgi:hypothetical protein